MLRGNAQVARVAEGVHAVAGGEEGVEAGFVLGEWDTIMAFLTGQGVFVVLEGGMIAWILVWFYVISCYLICLS